MHVDVPVSLLKVVKREGLRYLGELTPLLDDTEFERDRIDLPLQDLSDGRGPVLVADHVHASGARIVLWAE